MQRLFINIILLAFTFSGYSQSKEVNADTFYLNGIESLRHDLGKNIVNSISEIDKDYFIFFEITVKNKGSVLARELYRKPDAISAKVGGAIEATYPKWKTMDSNQKIIVPIFLINDQENTVQTSKIYTYTQSNYPFTNKIVNGFLMAPVVINYFHQQKGTSPTLSEIAKADAINWEKSIVCGDELELSFGWGDQNKTILNGQPLNIKFKNFKPANTKTKWD